MLYLLCGTLLASTLITGTAVHRKLNPPPKQELDAFGDVILQAADVSITEDYLPAEDDETELVDREEILAMAARRACGSPTGAELVLADEEPLSGAWFDRPCSSAGWVQEFV